MRAFECLSRAGFVHRPSPPFREGDDRVSMRRRYLFSESAALGAHGPGGGAVAPSPPRRQNLNFVSPRRRCRPGLVLSPDMADRKRPQHPRSANGEKIGGVVSMGSRRSNAADRSLRVPVRRDNFR
jgi:hypothetical protein